ncbi:MAG: aminopeptidase P family protein [Verrucomicrobiota bacterium]
MRHAPISPELFVENRQRLRALLPPKSVAFLNANDVPPTNADGSLTGVPNSDFFYLSGVEQEDSILVLAPDAHDPKHREILFLRETNDHIARWEGHKLTKDGARKLTGIQTIMWLEEFPVMQRLLMFQADAVFLNSNEHPRAGVEVESRDARFIRDTRSAFPLHRYERLAKLMHLLRPVKSAAEVELIQKACGITRDAFLRVLKFVKPGVNECEVEAEFAHEFVRQRARFAYNPIIASGGGSNVLHYVSNDQPCRKGDVLLLDVGAAYGNYAADMTRTIPVGGKFSKRQKQVYNAVLRVMRGCIAELKPGTLPRDWQKTAESLMQQELLELELIKPKDIKKQDPDRPALKKYFMHGVGHPLGLDVHDVATIGEPMQTGWVMTVEPGIYIPEEGFGIRLENDVLITAGGQLDLMADIPVEAGEIEDLMN